MIHCLDCLYIAGQKRKECIYCEIALLRGQVENLMAERDRYKAILSSLPAKIMTKCGKPWFSGGQPQQKRGDKNL
jgi:hypothetical protein